MAEKDMVMATQEELQRLHVVRKVIEKALKQDEAAEVLNLSIRQIRRIANRIQSEGDRGIVHRSRGQRSNRRLECRERVLKLFEQKYPDFGPTLASEKLLERDKIRISDETLRLWLIEAQIAYPQRRKRSHRRWRERKHHKGEMIQMDGSHHAWFEGRGPVCVMMGYIDDATGSPFAQFYEYEGTLPAMASFWKYVRLKGIPHSVYIDRHSTYKSTKKLTPEEELNNEKPLSQFERALEELGVKVIHALSPQAKGRIERLFKTFQDRLIKEMRLREIKTIEEGNRFLSTYLPWYAKRYGVKAVEEKDLHRPVPVGMNLGRILCIKTPRRLRNDNTFIHEKELYQVESQSRAQKVLWVEKLNGARELYANGKRLEFKRIKTRPPKEKPVPKLKRLFIPPKDHPWRKFKLNRRGKSHQLPTQADDHNLKTQLLQAA